MKTLLILKRVQLFCRTFLMLSALILSGATAQESSTQTPDSGLNAEQQAAVEQLFSAFGGNTAAARQALEDAVVQQAVLLLRAEESLPTFGGDGPLVVEFSDYNCGYCKRMLPILRDSNVQVKVIEFPVLGDMSLTAARYAIAAQKQGLYEPFHIKMMSRHEPLSEEALMQVAQEVGLDLDKLKADAQSTEVEQALQRNYSFANMLQVRGTPFFLVNGTPLSGAVDAETFSAMITQDGS